MKNEVSVFVRHEARVRLRTMPKKTPQKASETIGCARRSLGAVLLLLTGCGEGVFRPRDDDARAMLFTEVTAQLGLADTSESWPDGTYALHEITGGGVALFDYDDDGDLDILQICFPPPGKDQAPAPNRLLQQQADGTFVDRTDSSGLGDPGYGQGVAIGDVDNDGDLDVYITNFGPDAFYSNNGDGTFREATLAAGLGGDSWGTSAAFRDYDRDGNLDLYVVNYVQFDPAIDCKSPNTVPDYCNPTRFKGTLDTLYRNNGNGGFTNVTSAAGIVSLGKGLGVIATDLTGDGWVDFYVANDGEANQLWVNRGDGTFADEALIRGVAFNIYGRTEGSMGVTVGDANGDGQVDLFMTHLREETNTLYVARASGVYTDNSAGSGLSASDLPFTGFGCGFVDFDNDGDLDLAVVNGGVSRGPVVPGTQVGTFWSQYAESNLLFQNDGQGRFTDVSASAGGFTARVEVSRGLAFGDIDGDGDLDLVETRLGGLPRLFRNDAPSPGTHWLTVRAMIGKRDAIGAQVKLVTADKQYVRLVAPGDSYLSSHDRHVHFGLGGIDQVSALQVTWPDNSREHFRVPGVDRELTLHKGSGETL